MPADEMDFDYLRRSRRNGLSSPIATPTESEVEHTKDPNDALREWFARFGECCAAVDYESAALLFAEDVVSFGTRMDIVSGLEPLIAHQWKEIWPNIRDFRFDLDSLRAGGDEDLAWGVCLWTSTGFAEDGAPFDRPGRATVILELREGAWIARHSHFSLFPGTPTRTHGEDPRAGSTGS